MAHLAVRHKVRDYAAWKQVFDEFAPQRRAGGEVSYQIYHIEDDRNDIALVFEWDSMANLKSFTTSDELKGAMADAGVEGEPVIILMNAGDSGKP